VRPRFTVAQKIAAIAARLRWATEGIRFEQLFDDEATRAEVIVAFLALLELIRLRRARVAQDGLFGEIRVYPAGNATSDE
jgi:segregation and condensation protein A